MITTNERNLLLAVARILRAHMNDHINDTDFTEVGYDWADLNEALKPFDGASFSPIINAEKKAQR